jgi:hypothetical protein
VLRIKIYVVQNIQTHRQKKITRGQERNFCGGGIPFISVIVLFICLPIILLFIMHSYLLSHLLLLLNKVYITFIL